MHFLDELDSNDIDAGTLAFALQQRAESKSPFTELCVWRRAGFWETRGDILLNAMDIALHSPSSCASHRVWMMRHVLHYAPKSLQTEDWVGRRVLMDVVWDFLSATPPLWMDLDGLVFAVEWCPQKWFTDKVLSEPVVKTILCLLKGLLRYAERSSFAVKVSTIHIAQRVFPALQTSCHCTMEVANVVVQNVIMVLRGLTCTREETKDAERIQLLSFAMDFVTCPFMRTHGRQYAKELCLAMDAGMTTIHELVLYWPGHLSTILALKKVAAAQKLVCSPEVRRHVYGGGAKDYQLRVVAVKKPTEVECSVLETAKSVAVMPLIRNDKRQRIVY